MKAFADTTGLRISCLSAGVLDVIERYIKLVTISW